MNWTGSKFPISFAIQCWSIAEIQPIWRTIWRGNTTFSDTKSAPSQEKSKMLQSPCLLVHVSKQSHHIFKLFTENTGECQYCFFRAFFGRWLKGHPSKSISLKGNGYTWKILWPFLQGKQTFVNSCLTGNGFTQIIFFYFYKKTTFVTSCMLSCLYNWAPLRKGSPFKWGNLFPLRENTFF